MSLTDGRQPFTSVNVDLTCELACNCIFYNEGFNVTLYNASSLLHYITLQSMLPNNSSIGINKTSALMEFQFQGTCTPLLQTRQSNSLQRFFKIYKQNYKCVLYTATATR